jgi:hypothetical protein
MEQHGLQTSIPHRHAYTKEKVIRDVNLLMMPKPPHTDIHENTNGNERGQQR